MQKITPEQIQRTHDALCEAAIDRGCECEDEDGNLVDSEGCVGCEPRVMSDAANAIAYLGSELKEANSALNKIDGMTRQPGSPPPFGLALSCVYQVAKMRDKVTRLDSENETIKGAMERANEPCLGCEHLNEPPYKWFVTYRWRNVRAKAKWCYSDRITEEHPVEWLATMRERYKGNGEEYYIICMYRIPTTVAKKFEQHEHG